MVDGIEPLYQIIVEAIEDSIHEEWSAAQMEAVFFANGTEYYAQYTRLEDGETRSFPTTRRECKAFCKMRKLFKKAGQPLWGRACLKLTPDDMFNMEWGYENCDEKGFALFDEQAQTKQDQQRQRLAGV